MPISKCLLIGILLYLCEILFCREFAGSYFRIELGVEIACIFRVITEKDLLGYGRIAKHCSHVIVSSCACTAAVKIGVTRIPKDRCFYYAVSENGEVFNSVVGDLTHIATQEVTVIHHKAFRNAHTRVTEEYHIHRIAAVLLVGGYS